MKFVNPSEAIRRLAAAQGIDVLNLVKSPEQLEEQKAIQMQDQANLDLVKQAGQFAGTPIMEPEKNPDIADQAGALAGAL